MRNLPAALVAALVTIAPAWAEQVVVVDGHPVAFTASDTEVVFAIKEEDGKPLDTSGLAAKAYVQAEGKTQTLDLKPSAPNKLIGALAAKLPTGAKVVFSAKMHGHNIQARFANK